MVREDEPKSTRLEIRKSLGKTGVTGLAITIGAVITLFVLMQITARLSTDDVFANGVGSAPLPQGGAHGS